MQEARLMIGPARRRAEYPAVTEVLADGAIERVRLGVVRDRWGVRQAISAAFRIAVRVKLVEKARDKEGAASAPMNRFESGCLCQRSRPGQVDWDRLRRHR